ncbi:MAG: hypothetical protein ABR549_11140 [Mycobacteriales bacterium]
MRRRVGFLFICSAAIPIAIFASAAWACGILATTSSSPKVVAPGGTVTVTGRNFAAASSSVTPIELRWNSRTGPVLPGGVNQSSRGFTANVTVPSTEGPGWYVINAVQYNTSNGTPVAGTPGRTTVRVQGSGASSAAPWGAAKPTGGPGSPDLPLPGILLSVALLATGLTLVARDRGKKVARPVLGA